MRLERRELASFGFGTIGLEIVLSVIVGFLAGQWLDGKFGTTWLAYVGLGFGMAAAGKAVWRGYRQAQSQVAQEEREESRARAVHLGRRTPTSTDDLLRQADDALVDEPDDLPDAGHAKRGGSDDAPAKSATRPGGSGASNDGTSS